MLTMRFLANHKRLALYVALNVLLAVGLLTYFHYVHPRFTYDLDSASNWGPYNVRTYRNENGDMAHIEVLMGHKRLYSRYGEVKFSVEILGPDVTGNGVPNLVIGLWNGGAHGDSRYFVLALDGPAVHEVDVIDHLHGVTFEDLNGDGRLEVSGTDRAYDYFLGDSFAASPRALVVLSFDKTRGRFGLDKKLMAKPPLPRDEFNELSLKYKNDTRWSEWSRPPSELFDTMLKLIYTGNEKQAWELFDASWPHTSAVSKEEYREDVEVELNYSDFYSVIADWNSEGPWSDVGGTRGQGE